ncbi:MAG: permease-like cell division protein FtsX [Candidatus Homeothermus sp.]|nr:permease-like cell division protein FtsX [Candidatus Homeothermus sp.]
MEKKGKKGISTFSAQITSTVSVALVLLLLGIISMLGIAARSITTEIRENMGFSVIFSDTATVNNVNSLKKHFSTSPGVSGIIYFSPEDALQKWQEETGEDLVKVLGINPLPGELEVKVKARYASTDSINSMIAPLKKLPYVSEISVHSDMVDSINHNIKSIALILTIVAAALLFISFALINNTVRLTVYSRRFLIHTMKLVGATGGFIRRPIINSNMLSGLVAAIIADLLLAGALFYLHSADKVIAAALPWEEAAWVFAGIIVIGIAICSIASLFAINKYLRSDYDDMFK